MCGIFGLLVKKDSKFKTSSFRKTMDFLFKSSESRGKDAAGIAMLYDDTVNVYKASISASRLIRSKEYQKIFDRAFFRTAKDGKFISPLATIGHTRMATNGAADLNIDNQPVIKDGMTGVHNGIVVNDKKLWKTFPELKKEYGVDTEIILSLIGMFLKEKNSLIESVQNTFNLIDGEASTALLFNDRNYLVLATNTGSLYVCENEKHSIIIFASELYILRKIIEKFGIEIELGKFEIKQIEPGSGFVVDINNLNKKRFFFDKEENIKINENLCERTIVDLSHADNLPKGAFEKANKNYLNKDFITSQNSLFEKVAESIAKLRHCTKCILPETMPFIEFDKDGVCNYCRGYKKTEVRGKTVLEDVVGKYRRKDGNSDCIVTFSGGRDSSYCLHYVKKVLGMHPVAYSYDWGMITDLGRRNQARMCGKLGIEHILISADIKKKRENIKKNVTAWLKKPDLGTVPLFMAGDKQYFYYANKLKEQMGIKLIIIGTNPLEKTDFKSGFCGVMPVKIEEGQFYKIPFAGKLKLINYYAKKYIENPDYINASLFDTASAFFSYYLIPHDYLNLYQFVGWNEESIEDVLIKKYDWELANDTKTTWRIGDGTASFYNYIYYMMAGFTENDTFRSNQIREGMIGREKALEIVNSENMPRYESIEWYCNTIGIDFKEAIKIIDNKAAFLKQYNFQR